MDKFFLASAAVLLLISILLLTRLLKVKKFSEKFIVILVAGTNIALSYAVLGFISSLIVARYLEGKEK